MSPNLGRKIRFILIFIINPGIHIQTAFQGKPLEAKYIESIVIKDQKKEAGIKIYNEGREPLN